MHNFIELHGNQLLTFSKILIGTACSATAGYPNRIIVKFAVFLRVKLYFIICHCNLWSNINIDVYHLFVVRLADLRQDNRWTLVPTEQYPHHNSSGCEYSYLAGTSRTFTPLSPRQTFPSRCTTNGFACPVLIYPVIFAANIPQVCQTEKIRIVIRRSFPCRIILPSVWTASGNSRLSETENSSSGKVAGRFQTHSCAHPNCKYCELMVRAVEYLHADETFKNGPKPAQNAPKRFKTAQNPSKPPW